LARTWHNGLGGAVRPMNARSLSRLCTATASVNNGRFREQRSLYPISRHWDSLATLHEADHRSREECSVGQLTAVPPARCYRTGNLGRLPSPDHGTRPRARWSRQTSASSRGLLDLDVAQVDGFTRFDSEFLADLRISLAARGGIDHPICCARDQRWNCQPSFRVAN
jgi:hypothetical protein